MGRAKKSRKYFFDKVGDARMEGQNQDYWQELLRYILEVATSESLPMGPWDILDVGSHSGGMLDYFSRNLQGRAKTFSGVEPLEHCRNAAKKRLPQAQFFEALSKVPRQSIDLVVSHETLYLVDDLGMWVRELKRILRPDGAAFIALRSHGENTAWLRWRMVLEELYDHKSYIYFPTEILDEGHKGGFDMEIGQLLLKEEGARRYSPPEDGWGEFETAEEIFKFYREWKYLFIFYPKR